MAQQKPAGSQGQTSADIQALPKGERRGGIIGWKEHPVRPHPFRLEPRDASDSVGMTRVSIAPDANPGSSREWWRDLWLYFVLFAIPLVGYIHRLVINILIDPIGLEFGLTDTQASLLQGPPFALVYGLMVIPMGLLADRGSRVLLLGSGAILWSMGTLMCGLAPTFAWLFAARMLVGLGEAALMPAAVSLIGDRFPENRRGLAVGIFFMGINAGFSSAYAVGGMALDLAQAGALEVAPFLAEMSPWRQVFFVLALPGFILPLLLASIGEPERRTADQHYRMSRSMRRAFFVSAAGHDSGSPDIPGNGDRGCGQWHLRMAAAAAVAFVRTRFDRDWPDAGRNRGHCRYPRWAARRQVDRPLGKAKRAGRAVASNRLGHRRGDGSHPDVRIGFHLAGLCGYGDMGDGGCCGERDHVRFRIDRSAQPAERHLGVACHLGDGACRARRRADGNRRGAGGVCLRTRQGRCGDRRIGSATVLHGPGSGCGDLATGTAFAGTDGAVMGSTSASGDHET